MSIHYFGYASYLAFSCPDFITFLKRREPESCLVQGDWGLIFYIIGPCIDHTAFLTGSQILKEDDYAA